MKRLMTMMKAAVFGVMIACCVGGCKKDRTPEEVVEDFFKAVQSQSLDEAYIRENFCAEFLVGFERASESERRAFIAENNARGHGFDRVQVVVNKDYEDNGEKVKMRVMLQKRGQTVDSTNFKVIRESGQWKVYGRFRK